MQIKGEGFKSNSSFVTINKPLMSSVITSGLDLLWIIDKNSGMLYKTDIQLVAEIMLINRYRLFFFVQ